MPNRPMRARDCQPAAGLMSTCPQAKVNNYPDNLEVTYGDHIEIFSHSWLSMPAMLSMLYNAATTLIPHDSG